MVLQIFGLELYTKGDLRHMGGEPMLNATKEPAISCMALDASCNFAYLRLSRGCLSAAAPYLEQARYVPHGMTEPQLISTADRAIDMNLSTLRFCEILSKSGEPTSGLEPLI
jgi:hypothetical protein